MPFNKLQALLTLIYFFARTKLSKNRIIYKDAILLSSQQQRYTGNTKYLHEYLSRQKYKSFYITNDHSCENRISFKSPEYFSALKQCKTVCFTHIEEDISPYIPKKAIRINLWHGSPIKKMGFDSPTDKANLHKYIFPSMRIPYNRWNYVVIESEVFKDAFKSAFRYPSNKLLALGQPRNDIFFTDNTQLQHQVKRLLSIETQLHNITYAPTFRENGFDVRSCCETLRTIIENSPEYRLLIRLHPYDRSSIPSDFFSERIIDTSTIEDPQHLLLITDTLVTDYSSICFDFSALNRKIILYCPDRDAYEQARGGLYFQPEDLPFIYCTNKKALKSAIQDTNWKASYKTFPTPNSCHRIEQFLLEHRMLSR